MNTWTLFRRVSLKRILFFEAGKGRCASAGELSRSSKKWSLTETRRHGDKREWDRNCGYWLWSFLRVFVTIQWESGFSHRGLRDHRGEDIHHSCFWILTSMPSETSVANPRILSSEKRWLTVLRNGWVKKPRWLFCSRFSGERVS